LPLMTLPMLAVIVSNSSPKRAPFMAGVADVRRRARVAIVSLSLQKARPTGPAPGGTRPGTSPARGGR
jgi:hypothetical protein